MLKKRTRLLTMILTLVMVLSFAFAGGAFAANNYPNLTAFDGESFVGEADANAINAQYIDFLAAPADEYWTPYWFEEEADAAALEWDVVDGSISGVTVTEQPPLYVDEDFYYAYAVVTVAPGTDPGSASIVATGPNDAYVNFTVVVNGPTEDPSGDTAEVDFEVYNAAGVLLSSGDGTVQGNDFYSGRSFVTALDGVVRMVTEDVIDSYGVLGTWLTGMTINTVPYEPAYPAGWLYRIYREGGTPGQYDLVELSEVLGADDVRLEDGDYIQWRIGEYDDDALFPPYIIR